MTIGGALSELDNLLKADDIPCYYKPSIKAVMDTIALEQEPKTGHWIPTYGNVKCSVCGRVKDSRDVGKATHYCSKCGAMMVEPQKSEDT